LPAILKGWVDRVFAMGLVYGDGRGVYENGTFEEKTAFITMTTGGPEIAYVTAILLLFFSQSIMACSILPG